MDKIKRIFISHASIDSHIGEKFLDALVELGIEQSDVFYSSKYHTGVKLGEDFHSTVKKALKEAEIVVFLLTRSFYKSEFCLNEMGAVWISDTPFIPILLDGLSYSDMVGFIDNRYIAFQPSVTDSYKLLSELRKYMVVRKPDVDVEVIFNDFLISANKMAISNEKLLPIEMSEVSKTEEDILKRRFTDGELLLFIYFLGKQTNEIMDYVNHDYENDTDEDSVDLKCLKNYAQRYNFDYHKAKSLLEKSKLLRFNYDDEFRYGEYIGCELDIEIFRDLLSLTDKGKELIEKIKSINEIADNSNQSRSESEKLSEIEKIILDNKFKEIEALLFQYVIDTTSFALGDRWMAEGQKDSIKRWESDNNLNNKLSTNYDSALRAVIYIKLVDVASVTSYGNPREYKFKDEYVEQLSKLCSEAQAVLDTVILNNTVEELPF